MNDEKARGIGRIDGDPGLDRCARIENAVVGCLLRSHVVGGAGAERVALGNLDQWAEALRLSAGAECAGEDEKAAADKGAEPERHGSNRRRRARVRFRLVNHFDPPFFTETSACSLFPTALTSALYLHWPVAPTSGETLATYLRPCNGILQNLFGSSASV